MKLFKRQRAGSVETGKGSGKVSRSPSRDHTVLRREDFAEFLPDLQAVIEKPHSPLARLLIVLIAGFFGVALLWAHFSEVEQVAVAAGVVRPNGQTKTINHPVGGRVAELFVAEGSTVGAGEVLVRLDPELLQEQVAELANQWESLAAEVARFEAEALADDTIDFPKVLRSERPDLVIVQERLFEARREALASQRTEADRVIQQRESEAAAVVQILLRLKKSLGILREQEAMAGKLVTKNLFPRMNYLSIQREVSDHVGQIAEKKEQLSSAYAALEEAKTRRANIDRVTQAEVLDQMEQQRRERDALGSKLEQARGQLRNLDIVSPVAGIVQNLLVTSPGQAIRPSEAIMNVVPAGENLVIESEVSNQDIGYVTVGQAATVKVRTYNFVRFGSLDGVVEQVAADAIEDEKTGELTFKVFVRTSRTYLGEERDRMLVQPGMLVDVDFRIGERSILSYLTDRIVRTTATALRER